MRRIHVAKLALGEISLPPSQAHHLRDVLRLEPGAQIEAFDGTGAVGQGHLQSVGPAEVRIRIERIEPAPQIHRRLTIAAAIPKGGRADWMIEKLSELGTDAYAPLVSERGVVVPQGAEKYERWRRLAVESAKQCGRSGVMQIEPLTKLRTLLDRVATGETALWCLAPGGDARSIQEMAGSIPASLAVAVGPEGGWSEREMEAFAGAQIPLFRLTATVLRVETAAVAAAAIIKSCLTGAEDAARIEGVAADGKSP